MLSVDTDTIFQKHQILNRIEFVNATCSMCLASENHGLHQQGWANQYTMIPVNIKSKIQSNNSDTSFKTNKGQINKIVKTEKNKNKINKHKEKQVSIIDVHNKMSSSDKNDSSKTKKSTLKTF